VSKGLRATDGNSNQRRTCGLNGRKYKDETINR